MREPGADRFAAGAAASQVVAAASSQPIAAERLVEQAGIIAGIVGHFGAERVEAARDTAFRSWR